MNRVVNVRAALVVATAAVLGACQAPSGPGASVATPESDLIGGAKVALAELPSTVHLKEGCTAAKIGTARLLTAAHCVLDLSTLEPRYDASHPVRVSRDPRVLGYTEHAVAKVLVHPAFTTRCAETLCSVAAVVAKLDAPDVAILELATDLPDVPTVAVEPEPLVPGDRVVLVGYGCTAGVHVADERPVATLLSAEATILPAMAAVHDGSPVTADDAPVFGGNYVLTAGPGAPGGVGGLCPGDSGGPLYATRKGGLVVVGVNANYTLRSDEVDAVGLPVTNWHTRLDAESRQGVYSWIKANLDAR